MSLSLRTELLMLLRNAASLLERKFEEAPMKVGLPSHGLNHRLKNINDY